MVFGVGSMVAKAQVLDVPLCKQEQTLWCWAASAQCVLGYVGLPSEQCAIVEYVRSVSPELFGHSACCSYLPPDSCNKTNSLYKDTVNSVLAILDHFNHLQCRGNSVPLPLSYVATELVNGRPFLLRWKDWNNDSHIAVVYGMSAAVVDGVRDTSLYIMDPFDGSAHVSSYKYVVNSVYRVWDYSLRVNSVFIEGDDELVVGANAVYTIENSKGGGYWSTGNEQVANISNEGVVKALSVGTANITFHKGEGGMATKQLTVSKR